MLEKYLNKYFHYEYFRPGQKEVITSVLDGFIHWPCYLLVQVNRFVINFLDTILKGQVLIVSPLLSLMQDQVEQMKMNGEKNVVAINSFLSGVERKQVLFIYNNINLFLFHLKH